jgi:hypothetical protein
MGKSQGVYTTLATRDRRLDMNGSEYVQKDSFGPDETPAAVIIGYGVYNQQERVALKLTESGTGRTLMSRDYYASYGKAVVQPLAIRLSGNYELKLTSGDRPLDAYHFTVARTNQSGTMEIDRVSSSENYAEGVIGVSVDPRSFPGYFGDYSSQLQYWMVNCVSKEVGSTNAYLFAQRFPGNVVMECRLDYKGRLTEPKILENSLDDQCGEALAKALVARSPYGPWPEDAHQKLGSDDHEIKLTVVIR